MKLDITGLRPREGIALIEKIIEQDPKRGDIYLPRADTTNFDLAVILAVGKGLDDLKAGDYVYVHHGIMEEIEIGSNIGFIRNERIMAVIDRKDSKITN